MVRSTGLCGASVHCNACQAVHGMRQTCTGEDGRREERGMGHLGPYLPQLVPENPDGHDLAGAAST